MKKSILILFAVLTSVFIFTSFANPDNETEFKITVTADKVTKFDMFHNSGTTKGLKTPYELIVKTSDEQFIFKSDKLKSNLKVKVEAAKPNKRSMIGEWPIVVILIENDKITTFGLD